MNHSSFAAGALLALPLAVFAQSGLEPQDDRSALDDVIVVTADFRATDLFELGRSASVIDGQTMAWREATHIDQVLNLAPNVNFSQGASRGRFFQIRGIGERSQFVEPLNPSVGLVIDGIDLTGIGGAATTLDIAQVEILRGPQGTLLGANALAGMINLVANGPDDRPAGDFSLRLGERGTRAFEGALGGPLNETLGYRVSYASVQSDGAQNNAFLGTDDSAAIDEQTLRAKLSWQPSEAWSVDLTGLYLAIDNGYDGFSLDNTRTTLSDEPGHDRQDTLAGSVRTIWQVSADLRIEALLSRVDADLEYGFDEDWSFPGLCTVFECLAPGFSSFDNYLRNNRHTTLDLRALSRARRDGLGWVIGAYYRDQTQSLQRIYTFFENDFFSDFDTVNQALYGQLDLPLASGLTLKTGLRVERREADYRDSDGAVFHPEENFWGGRMVLEYLSDGGVLVYAQASRGYKAGGVNSDSTVPDELREFATETLWNYELGLKRRFFDGQLNLRAALFVQDRDEVQTQQALVVPIAGDLCPCRFVEFIDNAAAGQSYGLEAELNWSIGRRWQTFASLGLMDSRFDGFLSFSHVDADPETGQPFALDGRDLPHAPNYMFAIGTVFEISNRWYLRAEIEAKDAFFFSSRHQVRSNAYEFVHARLGYRTAHWDLALWARNITDQDIKTRGFGGFGNDPRKGYIVEPYFQFGEPRTLGITARYAF